MEIVARMARRIVALALALAVADCGSAPTTLEPTPGVSLSATGGPASTPRACRATESADAPASRWRDRVFYELFVRSFSDSDGDGVGDLRGLMSRLDYLNDGDPATDHDLGVTGIWLMPIAEAASYHGYDVTDYTRIERDYGTLEELTALLEAAHSRGIAVIVDLVINHTSSQHPWFRDAVDGGPHRDWYIWSDTDTGWPSIAGGNPWHPSPTGRDFYYGQFWEGMPDLNLRNPDVTAELARIARFWIDLGVDGFRIDAAKHLIEDGPDHQVNTPATHAWLSSFRSAIGKPDAFVVGEVLDLTKVAASYVPDALDSTFDFELASKWLLGAQIGDGQTIVAAQQETLDAYAGRTYAALLTNHDQTRVASQLSDPGGVRAAATLLLTNPGVPFIYYGEEIGLTGGKPDERIRSPMPWTGSDPNAGFGSGPPWEALEDGWGTRNVAAEAADPGSLLAHYRGLITLRREHPALSGGTYLPLRSKDPGIYAFLAVAPDERVAVVLNLADRATSDYGLSLDTGPCADSATLLYADPSTAATIAAPEPGTTRAIEGWRPLPTVPAHGTIVVLLD